MEKDGVLAILDREIESSQTDNTRTGFTSWVFISAIGALIWLFINQVQNLAAPVNKETVALIVFVGMCTYDALLMLRAVLFTNIPRSVETGRFKSPFDLSTRLGTAFFFCWSSLIILLVRVFDLPIGVHFKFFIYAFYGIFILIALSSFLMDIVLTFFDFSSPKSRTAVSATVFLFIGNVLSIALLLQLVANTHYSEISFTEWELGIVCLAIVYLICRWVANSSLWNSILPTLINLRRDLNFNHIDPDVAFQQADIAIYGQKLDHLMQKRLAKLMALYDEANQLIEEIRNLFAEIVKREEGVAPSEVEVKAVEENLDKLAFLITQKISSGVDSFIFAVHFAGAMNPPALEQGFSSIKEKLNVLHNSLKGRLDEMLAQYNSEVRPLSSRTKA